METGTANLHTSCATTRLFQSLSTVDNLGSFLMSENISGYALFLSNYCRLCFWKQLFQGFLLFPGISIFKFLSGKSSQFMVSDLFFFPVNTTSAYCLSQILKYSDPLVNAPTVFLVPGLRIPQGCLSGGIIIRWPCCHSSAVSVAEDISLLTEFPQYTQSWPVSSYFLWQSGSNISVKSAKRDHFSISSASAFLFLPAGTSFCWSVLAVAAQHLFFPAGISA